MLLQRPADNLAAECIEDDSEMAELLRQMQVDIGDPELIKTAASNMPDGNLSSA